MAIKKLNPESVRKINADIRSAAGGGVYDQMSHDIAKLREAVEARDVIRADGRTVPESLNKRIKSLREDVKRHNKKIITDNARIADLLKNRLLRIESHPQKGAFKNKIDEVKRLLFVIDKGLSTIGADVRRELSAASSILSGIESDPLFSLGVKKAVRAGIDKPRHLLAQAASNWQKIRPEVLDSGMKHISPGDVVFHDEKGYGRLLDRLGASYAKVEFRDDRGLRSEDVSLSSIVPGYVANVDKMILTAPRYIERGENAEWYINRINRQVKDLAVVAKGRRLPLSQEKAIADILEFEIAVASAAASGLTQAQIDSIKYDHAKLMRKYPAELTSRWTKDQQREFSATARRVWEKIRGLSTPGTRRAKGRLSSNPKAARKNPVRKAGSLILRCRSLWDAYCSKLTKKALKNVMDHLEKMRESTSKRVIAERSKCLRAAKKEAQRIGVKYA